LSQSTQPTSAIQLSCHSVSAMRAGMALTNAVSFTMERGDYLQLRGMNGIGKSTFLRQLAGLIPCDSGHLTINDAPYNPAQDRLTLKVQYLGHRDGLNNDLTGYENLQLLGAKNDKRAQTEPLYHRQLNSYSAGQRQRLNLLTLSDEADLWLLDEPSSNLDGDNLQFLEEMIKAFLKKGGMVIAATHGDVAQTFVTQQIQLEPFSKQPTPSQSHAGGDDALADI